MWQVQYILTFMEIKSYYSSFGTGREANKTMHRDWDETENI